MFTPNEKADEFAENFTFNFVQNSQTNVPLPLLKYLKSSESVIL